VSSLSLMWHIKTRPVFLLATQPHGGTLWLPSEKVEAHMKRPRFAGLNFILGLQILLI